MVVIFAIMSATFIGVILVLNRRNRRLSNELDAMKSKFVEMEKAKDIQQGSADAPVLKSGGVSESTILSIIGDIARIDNNLYHMQDVPGRKQILKALNRIKVSLQAEDYTIVPLLGTAYREGMQLSVGFVPDESLPLGSAIIISVQRPQVNRAGKMIQSASVTVGQNI